MRKSLREYQDPVERKNAHKFMFEYYDNKLKKMDIKSITPEHEKDLKEAFYHAKKHLKPKIYSIGLLLLQIRSTVQHFGN
jgi:hypothetical protein